VDDAVVARGTAAREEVFRVSVGTDKGGVWVGVREAVEVEIAAVPCTGQKLGPETEEEQEFDDDRRLISEELNRDVPPPMAR
jgi:hypothetical protein